MFISIWKMNNYIFVKVYYFLYNQRIHIKGLCAYVCVCVFFGWFLVFFSGASLPFFFPTSFKIAWMQQAKVTTNKNNQVRIQKIYWLLQGWSRLLLLFFVFFRLFLFFCLFPCLFFYLFNFLFFLKFFCSFIFLFHFCLFVS